MFADYEAYIKCQGQVDQLFMVRAAHYQGGGTGSLAMAVQWGAGMSGLLWSLSYRHHIVWA